MPVQSMWIPRTSKRRLERWVRDPVTGVVRLVEVLAAPGSDQSDAENQGAVISPLDDDAARTLDLFGQDDPAAAASVRNLVQALIDSDNAPAQRQAGQQTPAGQGGEQRGIALSPEKITSVVNLYNIALDARDADLKIDQEEKKLVDTMRSRGYNQQQIADFFQAGARSQDTPPAPGGATGVGQAASSGLVQSPAYDAAYGYQNQTALRAARQTRVESLQRVADAFTAHDEGAKWLEQYGDAARAQRDAEAEYGYSEAVARSQPQQDKNIVWTMDNQTTHAPGAAAQIRRGRQELDRALQARDPAAYAAQKAAEEEDRRQARIALGFGGYDAAQEYDPVTGRPREKKRLPAFQGGGLFEGNLFSSGPAAPAAFGAPSFSGSAAPLSSDLSGSGGGGAGGDGATWGQAGPSSLAQQGAEQQTARNRLETADRMDQADFERAMAVLQQDVLQRRAELDQDFSREAAAFQEKVARTTTELNRRASVLTQQLNVRRQEVRLGGLRRAAPPAVVG